MFKNNENSSIKHFTRGGQTFLHNFRMFNQIFGRALFLVLLIFLVLNTLILLAKTTPYQRYIAWEWLNANLIVFFNDTVTQDFIQLDGLHIKIFTKDLLTSPLIQNTMGQLWLRLIYSSLVSLSFSVLIFWGVSTWLRRRGEEQTQDKIIKGDRLVESEELSALIKKAKEASTLKLGNIPLPKGAERMHIMIHGSTGTGKSVSIRQFLDQIRARGEKAIIYDKSGDYMRFYYQNDYDVQLNQLDERSPSWHLWHECREAADYDSLAAALMPMPTGGSADPFWINAARTIFASAAYEMRKHKDRSTIKLLKTLLTADLEHVSDLLKGTEAESLVSEKAEKTAISIKSVLATYLKSLKYIKDHTDGEPFSIRKWIQDDNQRNWLFISSLADQHESLKPLISMWLDIAANALMSLEPSEDRRVWLILDELSSLHKLPYLNQSFAEARKFGGCLVIGLQSIAQLRGIYGQNTAEEISGLCNTRVFFRSPTSDTAKWAGIELGTCEIEEIKEGYSYGENSMRAGVSLSSQMVQRQLVNYSEIMALDNLKAYIRLPGGWPVSKIELPYKKYKSINTPFIRRELREESLKDIDQLIAQYEKPELLTTPLDDQETSQKADTKTSNSSSSTANTPKKRQPKSKQQKTAASPPGMNLVEPQQER